jgi:hypothetical protein
MIQNAFWPPDLPAGLEVLAGLALGSAVSGRR